MQEMKFQYQTYINRKIFIYFFVSFFIFVIVSTTVFFYKRESYENKKYFPETTTLGRKNNMSLIHKNNVNIFSELFTKIESGKDFEVFMFIYLNNTKSTFINIMGGFLFSIPTILNLIMNAYIISEVALATSNIIGFEGFFLSVIPHSIEIFGILLSSSVGFYISYLVIRFIKSNMIPSVLNIKIITFNIVLCNLMILLGAFLETYVSLHLH